MKYYRFLADNVQDIVLWRDLRSGFPTYMSPSIERVLDYTPEEVWSITLNQLLTEAKLQDEFRAKIHQKEYLIGEMNHRYQE